MPVVGRCLVVKGPAEAACRRTLDIDEVCLVESVCLVDSFEDMEAEPFMQNRSSEAKQST